MYFGNRSRNDDAGFAPPVILDKLNQRKKLRARGSVERLGLIRKTVFKRQIVGIDLIGDIFCDERHGYGLDRVHLLELFFRSFSQNGMKLTGPAIRPTAVTQPAVDAKILQKSRRLISRHQTGAKLKQQRFSQSLLLFEKAHLLWARLAVPIFQRIGAKTVDIDGKIHMRNQPRLFQAATLAFPNRIVGIRPITALESPQ